MKTFFLIFWYKSVDSMNIYLSSWTYSVDDKLNTYVLAHRGNGNVSLILASEISSRVFLI